jgi:hypothetical protein
MEGTVGSRIFSIHNIWRILWNHGRHFSELLFPDERGKQTMNTIFHE